MINAFEKTMFEYDTMYHRYKTLYEMEDIRMSYEQEKAQLAMIVENASLDDIGLAYMEAGFGSKKKKDGLLSKMIDVVIKIFNAISNKIKEIFNKITGKETLMDKARTSISAALYQISNFAPDLRTNIQAVADGIKNKKPWAKDLLKVAGTNMQIILMTKGAGVFLNSLSAAGEKEGSVSEKIKEFFKSAGSQTINEGKKVLDGKVVRTIIDTCKNLADFISGMLQKFKNSDNGGDITGETSTDTTTSAFVGALQSIGQVVSSGLGNIMSWIGGLFKGKNKDANDQTQPDQQTSPDQKDSSNGASSQGAGSQTTPTADQSGQKNGNNTSN